MLSQFTTSTTKTAAMGGETKDLSVRSKNEYPKLAAHPVGQWIPGIYRDRIAAFTGGGQYEEKNLLG